MTNVNPERMLNYNNKKSLPLQPAQAARQIRTKKYEYQEGIVNQSGNPLIKYFINCTNSHERKQELRGKETAQDS